MERKVGRESKKLVLVSDELKAKYDLVQELRGAASGEISIDGIDLGSPELQQILQTPEGMNRLRRVMAAFPRSFASVDRDWAGIENGYMDAAHASEASSSLTKILKIIIDSLMKSD